MHANVQENLFGRQLSEMRQSLGLSQADLALTLKSTQRHISFLETGRSRPSREMLGRIAYELSLSAGQRAALFHASGFSNPFPLRDQDSDAIAKTLDLIEKRVLNHWKFPALVLDRSWTILRMNQPTHALFSAFPEAQSQKPNLLKLFLSPAFRNCILNWRQASAGLYFRMQDAAKHSKSLHDTLISARDEGLFDHLKHSITDAAEFPVCVPVEFQLAPKAPILRLTSLLARLASVHDALLENYEIELMIPTDDETESILLSSK